MYKYLEVIMSWIVSASYLLSIQISWPSSRAICDLIFTHGLFIYLFIFLFFYFFLQDFDEMATFDLECEMTLNHLSQHFIEVNDLQRAAEKILPCLPSLAVSSPDSYYARPIGCFGDGYVLAFIFTFLTLNLLFL